MQNGNPPTSRVRHRKRSAEVVQDVGKANGDHLLVNDQNRYQSMLIRAYSSLWMLAGFALIIYTGHLFITAMVVVIQIFMARELFNLLRRAHEDRQLPGFRMLNWHFFFTAMFFVYGRMLSPRLVNTVTWDKFWHPRLSSIIWLHATSSILQIMMNLTLDEQQALFTRLGEILAERRIW